MILISLIVPVYNEENAVPIFYRTIRENTFLSNRENKLEIIFINDGSSDNTEKIIKELVDKDERITLINFSRNFGKEPALFAGIEYSNGDVIIPIDVDLQDPIELIPEMLDKWNEGYDVILAKRANRDTDSKFKRTTAELFYKIHNMISKPKIEQNVGDFRLMSRRVVEAIKLLPENNLFMKGVLSWVGFPTTIIEYNRCERIAGKTKFNGWKLWNLALEGITSFSTFPLRIWTYIGFFIAFISFLYGSYIILQKLILGNSIPGYPSIITIILFLGGIQLIGIGILGEYLGRNYIESKRRPKYVISELIKKFK